MEEMVVLVVARLLQEAEERAVVLSVVQVERRVEEVRAR
jgi:hypothetical protein